MKRRVLIITAILALLLGAMTVGAAANNQTLQDAISNAENGATVTLYTAATEAVSVDKDLVLDLNGNDIFELNVAEGKTVTVFDSRTDDYSVSDNIYGKIHAHSGNVCAANGYLAVTEDTALSFHKLTMEITAMSLRTAKEAEQDPGVYYKSNFCGDEVVAAQIEKFGIALNIKEAPNATNMSTTSVASSFSTFAAGETGNAGKTGTLVKGVIKSTNSEANNERNAGMPIYGAPYVQLKNGTYIFGNTAQRSLRQQMEMVDNNWSSYTAKAQESVLWMFRNCKNMISKWNIPNILEEMNAPLSDGKTLKLLAISSSFGENTNHYVYDAAIAEGFENVIIGRLYSGGCTLQTHLEKALSGENFYRYTKIQDGTWEEYKNTSMLTALQDEDWDVIFMQQSAHRSPLPETYVSGDIDYIDELVSYVRANKTNPKARFIWNLCWAFENGAPESEVWNRYGRNQLNMYQGLIDTLEQRVLTKNHFDAIIPTGTAVQNLRTSYIGDTLTKDKLHLNHLGRIMAAYTVLATVTGEPITEINISTFAKDKTENFPITEITEQDKLAIMEAVNNAITNPYEVTQSTYTTKAE